MEDVTLRTEIIKAKKEAVIEFFKEFKKIYQKHYYDFDISDRKLKKKYWMYDDSELQSFMLMMGAGAKSALNDVYDDISTFVKKYIGE